MSLTSRLLGKCPRQLFTNPLKPWLAFAGLLSLPGFAGAQDASTNTPAATPLEGGAPASLGLGTNTLHTTHNQISVSGDYSLDQGKITLPVGYSLNASLKGFSPPPPTVATPKRNSDYYGATISYSPIKTWYFDASYAQGTSTGTEGVPFGSYGTGTGSFTLDDDWYQLYVKHTFRSFFRNKMTAYVRLGGTYVDSTLDFASTSPLAAVGLYSQKDKTTDYYGNLGLGATYSFKTWGRFSMGLQGEIEGLGGERSQDSLETLTDNHGLVPVAAHINNTVYGGLGRLTLHLDYALGQSRHCHLFMDGGAQYRYVEVSYPGAGDQSETLYGPYVKLGLRYSF